MSSSSNALVAVTNNKQERTRKTSSLDGGTKQSSNKKQKSTGGKGSGKGSHKNSQQNLKDWHEDYRNEKGTNCERFCKFMAVLVQKPDSLKGLDARVKVKLRKFVNDGTGDTYASLTCLPGVSAYLKMGDFMCLYDKITTEYGGILNPYSTGYFVDQQNIRALLLSNGAELIFKLKPRVDGVPTVIDLATLTDAKLATITQCRGKEMSQHAAKVKSMPQVEYATSEGSATTMTSAKSLIKGGVGAAKGKFLTGMRLKLAKEFRKNPHAFMKDISTTAIKDTWTGKKNSTQIAVRFSRPFTREDFR